ncbi:hypothetical protein MA16_Dca008404 [Dendrobium catenatum]|uniref:Uncharacterized protein n=1 Tax=Dendrobium catenatum TaxID=906689 RepID=A0A2I0VM55_9ASPA|nr:hypothetical protein MA16_Dca008404 [Dendrobium catenatum]
MTEEGNRPPPSDATDGRRISSNAIKILPRPVKGVSPPAFRTADYLFEGESKLKLENSCALVINEGGLSHPKKYVDFIGKGKAVLKEIMDEMPNFSVLKNNLNKADQNFKDDSILVNLQPELEMANKVRMENEEDTSPGSKKSNRKESSAVGNFGECHHLSDDMVSVQEYISAELGNYSKAVFCGKEVSVQPVKETFNA